MNYSNGLGNLQNLLGTIAASDAKRADAATPPANTATAAIVTADQTNFSSTSGVLGQALSGPNPDSDVRMPMVLALSAAIADGTYQVSSLDVSGKMIDSMLR
jgi:negative regulator of flagellin synthesis FlgM